MNFYSQKDPAYSHLRLGASRLTIGSHGCFVCAMATLFQRHPQEVLSVPGAVTPEGLLISGRVARAFSGDVLPPTQQPPRGWCIAITDHYKASYYPTHFFVANVDEGLQIDPLDFPANVEPLHYKIVEYRPFAGIALETENPDQQVQEWATYHDIIASGWEMPHQPMSQLRTAHALKKYENYLLSKYRLIAKE